jgi:hypothetical protein
MSLTIGFAYFLTIMFSVYVFIVCVIGNVSKSSLKTQPSTFTRKASTSYLLHKSLLQATYVKEGLSSAEKQDERGFGTVKMAKATS